jgi:hypothetical protein
MFDEAFLVTEKFKANENCKLYFFIVVINQRIWLQQKSCPMSTNTGYDNDTNIDTTM